MRKHIAFTAAAALLVLLAGCQSQSNQTSGIPVQPKWKGAPYRLAFGPQPAKANPAGLTLPPIKYTANPDALQTRADLVVQFDTANAKTNSSAPLMDQMIMAPTDISGAAGTLPADYTDLASKDLAKMLDAYHIKGKVKINVALAESSLNMPATDEEVNDKRLSDWAPLVIDFKSPHR